MSYFWFRSSGSYFWFLGLSNGCRWSWCRPWLLVWLGHLLRVCIRGFTRFFSTGLLCIRYAQRQKYSHWLLQGNCQWFTRLSRAWSEMVPSGLVASITPVRSPWGKAANQRRHEHAAQERWLTSDRVCRLSYVRCHPHREWHRRLQKAHDTSP